MWEIDMLILSTSVKNVFILANKSSANYVALEK